MYSKLFLRSLFEFTTDMGVYIVYTHINFVKNKDKDTKIKDTVIL